MGRRRKADRRWQCTKCRNIATSWDKPVICRFCKAVTVFVFFGAKVKKKR